MNRRLWWIALATSCAGLAYAADPSADPTPGRLRGEVRDSERAQRLPGAALFVAADSLAVLGITTSDAKGFLALDGLPSGRYRVIATAAGFTTTAVTAVNLGGPFRAVVDLPLKRGLEQPVELVLGRGEGSQTQLSIEITDDSGKPLAGVLVRCEPVAHRADPAEGRTQSDGRLTLGPLVAGGWKLTVARAGWARLVVPSVAWPSGELRVVARLIPSGDSKAPVGELLPPGELQ